MVRPPQAPGIFFSLVCLSLFAASCVEKEDAGRSAPRADQPTLVDVIVAESSALNNSVEANGSIVAGEYVELHPEVSGRITFLDVPEGGHVEKGFLFARINDADLQAQLEKSKVLLDLYQKTEERDRKLLAINGLNQADYDLALNNVNSTKADIAYTQAQLDKTLIRAPFSGTVGLRQVSPGAYVSPANIIATIQQLDKNKIDFTLPEQYSRIVRKGEVLDVEVDASAKIRRKAVIIATEPQVNQTSRNLKVRAVLQDGQGHPGAFVKVFINAGSDKKAILVPTNCIIPDDKNSQVILIKDGKALFANVQTGIREANNVEINSGIHAGDTVIVTGVLFARPQSRVNIRSVKTLEQLAANHNN
ncbi:MAG: efflux RND transporter periplasmic adaptor subunit [Puia sp.]|nr:efflux RND transporter periplasmic adaptor subunit [Puia sp.]